MGRLFLKTLITILGQSILTLHIERLLSIYGLPSLTYPHSLVFHQPIFQHRQCSREFLTSIFTNTGKQFLDTGYQGRSQADVFPIFIPLKKTDARHYILQYCCATNRQQRMPNENFRHFRRNPVLRADKLPSGWIICQYIVTELTKRFNYTGI